MNAPSAALSTKMQAWARSQKHSLRAFGLAGLTFPSKSPLCGDKRT